MANTISYDFSDMRKIVQNIKTDPNKKNLEELKRELNRFFKDSKCLEIIYTENTDKLFFGMSVVPKITSGDVHRILLDEETIRFDKYYLEIDSKLLDPLLGLDEEELIAILLHEVGHVVNDTKPVEVIRKSVDSYIVDNKEDIKIENLYRYTSLFVLGFEDAIRKFCSIFEKDNSELLADEFVHSCGYGPQLQSALNKILAGSSGLNRGVSNKFIVLSWVLRLYKEVKLRRLSALKTLQKGESLTASQLQKRELKNVSRDLNSLSNRDLQTEGFITSIKDTLRKSRSNSMRSLEEDVYEFNLRLRNVEDEDEALYLLRSINTRIAILDDYVHSEDLSESERRRWLDTLDQFKKQREMLSKTMTYKKATYGIFMKYPDIVENRQ